MEGDSGGIRRRDQQPDEYANGRLRHENLPVIPTTHSTPSPVPPKPPTFNYFQVHFHSTQKTQITSKPLTREHY